MIYTYLGDLIRLDLSSKVFKVRTVAAGGGEGQGEGKEGGRKVLIILYCRVWVWVWVWVRWSDLVWSGLLLL